MTLSERYLSLLVKLDMPTTKETAMKRQKRKTPYIPRVVIKMNTGTRTILSKKDKDKTRRALNKKTKEMWC